MGDKMRLGFLHLGVAGLLSAAAVGIRYALDPWLGDHLPFVTVFGIVALAVWFGGRFTALLTVVLGYVACDWLFVAPRGTWSLAQPYQVIGLLAYLLSCSLIVWFGEAMRSALQKADEARGRLEQESARRRDSEKRFRLAADAVNGIIYEYDLRTGMVERTRGLFEVLGYHADEVPQTAEWWKEQIHPADRESARHRTAQSLPGNPLVTEYRLRHKDGRWLHVEDRAVLFNDGGKVVKIVGCTVDITERKRAEEQARATLQQLQIVADTMSAPVTRCSRDLRYLWVSKPYAQWVGRAAEDIVGRPIVEVLGDEAFEQLLPYFRQVLAGEQVRYETTINLRDRGPRWVSAIYTPTFDAAGGVDGWVAMVQDVHERKLFEDRLEKKNARLRLLSEAAASLLHADDPEEMLRQLFAKIAPHFGLDTYFNFLKESGDTLRLASCAGIPAEVAAGIERLEFGQAICGSVARQRQPLVVAHVQESDDPRAALARSLGLRVYACNPLLSGDELLGTLSFASRSRDRFDDNELEFLGTLSHYVTVALERVRLLRQLQDADRRKDEFLATLAHELRNPLAPVANSLELMKRANGSPELIDRARATMERQVRHMVRLVDDLLDVSRITRNKLELKKERVELATVVQQAVEACRPLCDRAGHELQVELPPEVIYLNADPVRLTQVVGNLLTNSCKYTNRGGRIRLSVERHGSDVTVTVTDNGIGIPEEMLPRVFDLFTQVDRSLERAEGGLGIGLSLVKRLVEMHDGTVTAASAGHGKGSTFVVRLPILIESSKPQPAPKPSAPATPVKGRRILVVDDNRDSAVSLAMLLKMTGNETQTAFDGEEAVQKAEKFRPQAILLDIGLPKLNGYDACRTIREQSWGKDIIIVALTGWGQEEDRRRSKEAGFDGHLVKPVDLTALLKLLAQKQPVEV